MQAYFTITKWDVTFGPPCGYKERKMHHNGQITFFDYSYAATACPFKVGNAS